MLGTLAAVLLGTLQVSSPIPTQSPWYLYRRTNHGVATGFFANSNHMATLLVISIAVSVRAGRRASQAVEEPEGRLGRAAAGGRAGLLTLLVGIFLNGSLAALLLGLPVAAISATLLLPHQAVRLRGPVAALALLSVAAMAASI